MERDQNISFDKQTVLSIKNLVHVTLVHNCTILPLIIDGLIV